MESLHKLETTVAGWLKAVPHLPVNVQKWIAENMWWITIVGVAFGAFGIITVFGTIAVLGAFGAAYAGAIVGAALTGAILVAAFITMLSLIVTVVLEALAIKPLKAFQKRGWDLLFLSVVVTFGFSAVSSLLGGDVFGLIRSVLIAGVSSYFLTEISSYFKPAVKVVSAPVVKK